MSWKTLWKVAGTPPLPEGKKKLLQNIKEYNTEKCKICEKELDLPNGKLCSKCKKDLQNGLGNVHQDYDDAWGQ